MTDPSAAWARVRSLVRYQQPSGQLPVLEVKSVDGEETAVAGLLTWFDRHNEGTAVLLRVDDKDLGVVSRDDIFDMVVPSDRGGLGVGDGLTLPGVPNDYRLFEYVCPVAGCHRRKAVVSADAGPTPTCPVHGVSMVPHAAR